MNEAVENMFDELNDLYQAEQQRRNNNNHHHHWNVQQQFEAVAERVIDAAIAELTLYRDEPSLPLQNSDGSFSCPLRWWKNNKGKYKMISNLALCVLCIPATSAPSKWFFCCCRLENCQGLCKVGPTNSKQADIPA
jgi:hypothetical protein